MPAPYRQLWPAFASAMEQATGADALSPLFHGALVSRSAMPQRSVTPAKIRPQPTSKGTAVKMDSNIKCNAIG
jgi:hypothetical protein